MGIPVGAARLKRCRSRFSRFQHEPIDSRLPLIEYPAYGKGARKVARITLRGFRSRIQQEKPLLAKTGVVGVIVQHGAPGGGYGLEGRSPAA
jgi:hypothetical protein